MRSLFITSVLYSALRSSCHVTVKSDVASLHVAAKFVHTLLKSDRKGSP